MIEKNLFCRKPFTFQESIMIEYNSRRIPQSSTTRGRVEKAENSELGRRERIQEAVSELQEALDYLRLSVKYLVFDLEATRRENAYLRRLIEEINRERENRQNGDDENDEE